jgi:hypothetical protein
MSCSCGTARVLVVLPEEVEPRLADDFVERYLCWREECAGVEIAYGRWRGVPQRDRTLAFAAYRAALDREEHAARVFGESAGQLFG